MKNIGSTPSDVPSPPQPAEPSPAVESSPSSPLLSGFGSLIEEEHELQTYLKECIHSVGGQHGESVDRIFVNHLQEIEEILELLYRRSELLPHPFRFGALKSGAPIATHAHRPAPTVQPVLRKLVGLHLHLQRGIEALLKKDRDAQRDELILTQVAQRHDEMGWMLTALLKEDGPGRDPEFSAIIGTNPPLLSAQTREQESEDVDR